MSRAVRIKMGVVDPAVRSSLRGVAAAAAKRSADATGRDMAKLAEQGWKDVQANLGKFQQYFGPNKFFIVDNNDHQEDLMNVATKMIARAVRKPVNNPIAKAWIANEMKRKSMSIPSNLDNYQGRNVGKGGGGYVKK